MNRGLYAFAGDSATATEAAWANRFEEPMTNVSNVYFGLSRLPPVSGVAGRRSSRPVPGTLGRGGGGMSSSAILRWPPMPTVAALVAGVQALAASYPASYPFSKARGSYGAGAGGGGSG